MHIDVLILGCTHFPLIIDKITACSGNGMKVINSAVEIAKDVKKVLEAKNIFAGEDRIPERIFYETGNSSNFFDVGKMFLGDEIKEVTRTRLQL